MKMAKFICFNLAFLVSVLSIVNEPILAEICFKDVCEFELVIHRQRTMTYIAPDGNAYDVEMNITAKRLQVVENSYYKKKLSPMIGKFLDEKDVITADGFARNIFVVNGQFPGPTLEVKEGAQVRVKVINDLYTEGITIHWHGIHMVNNMWMDGTAYVTQCPIQPHQSFTYQFKAQPVGTHWYHSHLSNQRLDGLYGMFVVHKEMPKIPYHTMTLQDWRHISSTTVQITSPFSERYPGTGDSFYFEEDRMFTPDGSELSSTRYTSTIINGRGRINYENEILPLHVFNATTGSLLQFRTAHTGAEYSYEIMIDNHELFIIASDGQGMEPIAVNSFFIGPGETVDFVIHANQMEGSYWVRTEVLQHRSGLFSQPHPAHIGGRAILTYNGSVSKEDPKSSRWQCTTENPCRTFNCPFKGLAAQLHKKCITYNDVKSIYSNDYLDEVYGLNDEEYEEIFLNIGFHIASAINARRFILPRAPFSNPQIDKYMLKCDPEVCKTGCKCTNIIDLPANKTIQLIISNYQSNIYVNHHIMHLHGHNFLVMKMGLPDYNETSGLSLMSNDDVKCDTEDYCTQPYWNGGVRPMLNTDRPPIKDSVYVPSRGYTVLRFKTHNPGYWYFHCHLESHNQEGMALVFNEAPGFHPSVPDNFVQCGDF